MPPLTIIECVSAHYALLVLVLVFFFFMFAFAFLAAAFPAGVYAYFRPATYGILVSSLFDYSNIKYSYQFISPRKERGAVKLQLKAKGTLNLSGYPP